MNTSRTAIRDAAADWFVKSQDDSLSAQDRQQLAKWLRESPVHIEEYLAIARLWSDIAELEDINELIVDAEQISDASAVIPIHNNPASPRHTSLNHGKRMIAAAAFAFCIVASLYYQVLSNPTDIHETRIGEQRSVLLEDGSLVDLNTASEIEVEFTEDMRLVKLLSGEAYFDVTENSLRPFVVEVGNARVRVVGTRFNIYRLTDSATVTVLEGNVAIAVEDGKAGTRLGMADQATINMSTKSVSTRQLAKPTRYIAWKDRRLVFEHTKLKDVMAEFARYSNVEYHITDADAAALELTGTFESHDVKSLIEYLEMHERLTVSRVDSLWIVSGR